VHLATASKKKQTTRTLHLSRTRTKFATFETPWGHCDLLVKVTQSASHEDVCARVSLLPTANSAQNTRIIFQSEQHLQYLGVTQSTPTSSLSFRATRSWESEVFDVAKYGSAADMARLFTDGQASVTDSDQCGCSLLGVSMTDRTIAKPC
jgi:hypothetical protein